MIEMFHKNFDAEAIAAEAHANGTRSVIYSQTEVTQMLAEAHESSFQAGHRQGMEQGLAEVDLGLQADLKRLFSVVEAQIETLLQQASVHQTRVEEQAAAFAVLAAERILPQIQNQLASECATQSLRRTFALTKGIAALSVRLSPATHQHLLSEGFDLACTVGPKQTVIVVEDAQMSDGDARVEWQDGWADYSLDETCAHILQTLQSARSSFVIKGN